MDRYGTDSSCVLLFCLVSVAWIASSCVAVEDNPKPELLQHHSPSQVVAEPPQPPREASAEREFKCQIANEANGDVLFLGAQEPLNITSTSSINRDYNLTLEIYKEDFSGRKRFEINYPDKQVSLYLSELEIPIGNYDISGNMAIWCLFKYADAEGNEYTVPAPSLQRHYHYRGDKHIVYTTNTRNKEFNNGFLSEEAKKRRSKIPEEIRDGLIHH